MSLKIKKLNVNFIPHLLTTHTLILDQSHYKLRYLLYQITYHIIYYIIKKETRREVEEEREQRWKAEQAAVKPAEHVRNLQLQGSILKLTAF